MPDGAGYRRGAIDRQVLATESSSRGLHVMAYPAMIDVPGEPVRHLAQLLAAERRARGTRRGTPASTCFYQALPVLVWFRTPRTRRFWAPASASAGPPHTGTWTK